MFEKIEIHNKDNDNLVVVFNSLAADGSIDNDKYDFYKTFEEKKCIDKMFFKNTDHTWYINDIDEICNHILIFTEVNNIKNVCIIGHSCGGFASILSPYILRKKNSSLNIKSISFSPQTNINIDFSSNLLNLFGKPTDMSMFTNYDKIDNTKVQYLSLKDYILYNITYYIYICEHNKWDKHYIDFLNCQEHKNIEVILLNCNHHASAYFCKCSDMFKNIFSQQMFLFP